MNELNYEAKCKHEPCGCPVTEYGNYCSEWCEQAIETTDCGCGHIECRAIA
jgi:hypothetical protein